MFNLKILKITFYGSDIKRFIKKSYVTSLSFTPVPIH